MLLTHTSGLSYGFDARGLVNQLDALYVDRLYRAPDSELTDLKSGSLAEFCDQLAQLPLLFEPGSAWHYGYNTDVVGRLIEVISGQSLGHFLEARIFTPLAMPDTGFTVPECKRNRFCDIYMRKGQRAGMLSLGMSKGDDTGLTNMSEFKNVIADKYLENPEADQFFFSGGGGLVGTCRDYLRFSQCLLNGGELDGVRILGRKTVQLMSQNRLGQDPASGLHRDLSLIHISEPTRLLSISYAVFCLKKKKKNEKTEKRQYCRQ
eukprot:TRINITY_DN13697_c0_g1_i3.p1 TRINITY_DN13697_c0_g1~~TRINITY_DN13697_c0_g1_i3.p1  ORF type:complete len:263 (-),score=56.65 TRINITY_DN13697_c0_g1_i3:28-816(-)